MSYYFHILDYVHWSEKFNILISTFYIPFHFLSFSPNNSTPIHFLYFTINLFNKIQQYIFFILLKSSPYNKKTHVKNEAHYLFFQPVKSEQASNRLIILTLIFSTVENIHSTAPVYIALFST